MTTATVTLWGNTVGYVKMDAGEKFSRFEYDPTFVDMGIDIAPLKMPTIANRIYSFRELEPHSFHGLPGLLSDSLPDKYGHKLIDVWLANTGRKPEDFNAVDRLCYTGQRGMGALEFTPATDSPSMDDTPLDIKELVDLASLALSNREDLNSQLKKNNQEQVMKDILSIGTSAGGARAKAVIAYNPETTAVRSGQINLPRGHEHWLIKFDGVDANGDWGKSDPAGYGLLEYSYYKMAKRCGITMMESQLFSENGRNHFMTQRFDRDVKGNKFFVQTFGAIGHFDYYESGHYSYEQLFMTMKQLNIPHKSIEEQFRRMVFNLVSCNQDDHVKNFAFMMDQNGQWDITPAYDLCHAEGSEFTRNHQLSLNGKTNDFELADLKAAAEYIGLPRGREKRILEQVTDAFAEWPLLSKDLEIPQNLQDHVMKTLRLKWK